MHQLARCKDRSAGAAITSYAVLVSLVALVVIIGITNFQFATNSLLCKGLNGVDVDPISGISRYTQYWTNENALKRHTDGKAYCRKTATAFQWQTAWYSFDASW